MSGIAALLLELGHDVTGSDKVRFARKRSPPSGWDSASTRQHRAEDANDAEIVIFSSAIKKEKPDSWCCAARETGRQLVRRAEALAAIMAGQNAES